MFNSKKYNIVLIIIYRFTKYTLYIPTTNRFTVKSFITLFLEYIFRSFGLLDNIISDKDNLFISKFQSIFCYYLVIKRRLNIVFYLQTDSQIKKLNQFLEYYLQNYYNFKQNDWAIKLFLVEFVYNILWYSSTGIILVSAFLRFDFKGFIDLFIFIKIGRTLVIKDCMKQLRDRKKNIINLFCYNQVVYKK